MNTDDRQTARIVEALSAEHESVRLKAALAAGTTPDTAMIDTLVERCAVEPDFYVRDMLTWALIRQLPEYTVPRLIEELASDIAQARSQALHTLSKVKDASAWPSITRALLHDADDEVARSAWRAAVVLVPAGEEAGLAADLAAQLGRGGREMQRSLSRALVALGEAAESVVKKATKSRAEAVRAHAKATEKLLRDPDADFDLAIDAAKRAFILGRQG